MPAEHKFSNELEQRLYEEALKAANGNEITEELLDNTFDKITKDDNSFVANFELYYEALEGVAQELNMVALAEDAGATIKAYRDLKEISINGETVKEVVDALVNYATSKDTGFTKDQIMDIFALVASNTNRENEYNEIKTEYNTFFVNAKQLPPKGKNTTPPRKIGLSEENLNKLSKANTKHLIEEINNLKERIQDKNEHFGKRKVQKGLKAFSGFTGGAIVEGRQNNLEMYKERFDRRYDIDINKLDPEDIEAYEQAKAEFLRTYEEYADNLESYKMKNFTKNEDGEYRTVKDNDTKHRKIKTALGSLIHGIRLKKEKRAMKLEHSDIISNDISELSIKVLPKIRESISNLKIYLVLTPKESYNFNEINKQCDYIEELFDSLDNYIGEALLTCRTTIVNLKVHYLDILKEAQLEAPLAIHELLEKLTLNLDSIITTEYMDADGKMQDKDSQMLLADLDEQEKNMMMIEEMYNELNSYSDEEKENCKEELSHIEKLYNQARGELTNKKIYLDYYEKLESAEQTIVQFELLSKLGTLTEEQTKDLLEAQLGLEETMKALNQDKFVVGLSDFVFSKEEILSQLNEKGKSILDAYVKLSKEPIKKDKDNQNQEETKKDNDNKKDKDNKDNEEPKEDKDNQKDKDNKDNEEPKEDKDNQKDNDNQTVEKYIKENKELQDMLEDMTQVLSKMTEKTQQREKEIGKLAKQLVEVKTQNNMNEQNVENLNKEKKDLENTVVQCNEKISQQEETIAKLTEQLAEEKAKSSTKYQTNQYFQAPAVRLEDYVNAYEPIGEYTPMNYAAIDKSQEKLAMNQPIEENPILEIDKKLHIVNEKASYLNKFISVMEQKDTKINDKISKLNNQIEEAFKEVDSVDTKPYEEELMASPRSEYFHTLDNEQREEAITSLARKILIDKSDIPKLKEQLEQIEKEKQELERRKEEALQEKQKLELENQRLEAKKEAENKEFNESDYYNQVASEFDPEEWVKGR